MPATSPKLRLLVRHSDSPEDQALAAQLLAHLRPLEDFANFDLWSEAEIGAGADKAPEVEKAIQSADIALLLLSADFLGSDALLDVEVPLLQERHASGKLRVIPVLIRSCLWDLHPWFKQLDLLPRDGKPIAAASGEARDAALSALAREVAALVASSGGAGAVSNKGPAQWILVAGTGAERLPQHQAWVSEKLGEALARADLGLITGGWHGVDASVTAAFARVSRLPLDASVLQVVPVDTSPILNLGQVVYVPREVAEWVEALNRADGVVLIGGMGGTFKTYEHARRRRIPVFPIPGTGGDAHAVFGDMLSRWEREPLLQRASRADLERLDVPIEVATDAGRAVKLLMALLLREIGGK